jgi:hypothetical protein
VRNQVKTWMALFAIIRSRLCVARPIIVWRGEGALMWPIPMFVINHCHSPAEVLGGIPPSGISPGLKMEFPKPRGIVHEEI